MKNLKNTKGITLIALIITIIVLLILAGVTISMLTGDNGILKNAQKGAEQYNIAQGKERIELILSELQMEKTTTGVGKTIDQLVEIFPTKEGINSAEKIDDNTIKVVTDEGYEYEVTIDDDGKTDVEYTGEGEIQTPTTPPDETGPQVSIQVKETNATTVIITVNTEKIDLAEEGTYKYYLGETEKEITTENSYVYTGLSHQTPYTLKVVVTDKAGNEITNSIEVTTKSIVPSTFVASSVDKEDTIDGGLVIYEGTEAVTTDNHPTALTSRNQYVWIPVSDINSMSMCASNEEGSICNLQLQTDGTLKCTVHPNTATQIVGRLYTSSLTGSQSSYSYIMDFTQTNQEYDANSGYYDVNGYREPAVVTNNDTGTGTYYDGASNNYHGYGTASAFLTELQAEYKKMATSVAKNGGFYVARYEMGAKGVSKKNQAVINATTSSANMWYGLYEIAKDVNTTLNSHMIWRKSIRPNNKIYRSTCPNSLTK